MSLDFKCACKADGGGCGNLVNSLGGVCSDCLCFCGKLEAKHFDDNKPELQYILAMPGLLEVAKVNNYGAGKYGQWNYRTGMPWMKLLGSCSRHLSSFICGEDLDPESGLAHLAHLCYNALMLLGYMKEHPKFDDRYKG